MANPVADTFNRADSTTTLGSTSTGSVAWSALRGTWGISTNRAYVSTTHASGTNFAVVETGVVDAIVQFTVAGATASTEQCGIYFRATDANNGYILEGGSGASKATLYKFVAGAATSLAQSAANVQFETGDVVQVVLFGSSITVKVNGSAIIALTDSTFLTQTAHGLYVVGASAAMADDFSVTTTVTVTGSGESDATATATIANGPATATGSGESDATARATVYTGTDTANKSNGRPRTGQGVMVADPPVVATPANLVRGHDYDKAIALPTPVLDGGRVT